MAYISYNRLGDYEFYNNVSAEDTVQDINPNQLKFKVNDSYKEDEKRTTHFEAVIDEDVINKAYLEEKLSKIDGHLSFYQNKIILNSNCSVTSNLLNTFYFKEL